MSRLLLWLAARVVPRERRSDWIERWHAELWALEGSRATTSRFRFALGAVPDALAEWADGWREGWSLRGFAADIRDGWRAARRRPGTTALAVLVLGFGTTATASIFSLADAVLLRHLPGLAEPDRLVQIGRHDADQFDNFSFPNYADLARAVAPAVDLAGFSNRAAVVGRGVDARVVPTAGVTANFFRVLGVPIVEGPGFSGTDTSAFMNSRVVIVSRAFWREHGEAIQRDGGSLHVNGQPYAVVGVTPPAFAGAATVGATPELWVPLGGVRTDEDRDAWIGERGHSWIFAIGRLRPGVSVEAASAAVAGAHAGLAETNGATIGEVVTVVPGLGLRPAERAEARDVVRPLFAVAAIVLVIAAANVAGLQFARGLGRRHELAVRASLGASRRRLWRALVVEQAMLAAGGACVAFALAAWSTAWLREALPYRLAVEFGPDLRLLAFAFVVAILTSTIVALWPLRRVVGGPAADSMRTRVPETTHRRTGRALVFVEVALSTVLLVCGGLLVRSSMAAARVDPGFATDALVVTLRAQPGHDAARRADDVRTALATLPGVTGVAAADGLPVADENARAFRPPGASQEAGDPWLRVISAQVASPYFDLLGLRAVSGRLLTAGDRVAAETPAVINQAMAGAMWPDRDAVGQTWTQGPASFRVVGVIADTSLRSLRDRGLPGMWTPLDPANGLPARWLVRSAAPGGITATHVRDVLAPFGDDVIISRVDTMPALIGESLGTLGMATELLVWFALAALAMAALGLYSVSSLQVSRQRQDIGIRLALGAAPRTVTRAVLSSSLVTALAGAATGAVGAVFTATFLDRLLFSVGHADPIAILVAVCGTAAVAVAAAAGPARRAARTDPLTAMRSE